MMPDSKPHAEEQDPEIKVVDRRWWVHNGPDASPAGEEVRAQPRKPTYVEELERQLADKDTLLQEYITRYKEATREFDNVKVRLRRDVGKEVERGKRAILVELLDVVDNLDRAIDAARRASEQGRLLEGVEIVRTEFLARLEGFGARRMAPLGQTFDPARHEAATIVPVTETSQENIVLGVIREGYELGGEVLRPALVAVGQRTE